LVNCGSSADLYRRIYELTCRLDVEKKFEVVFVEGNYPKRKAGLRHLEDPEIAMNSTSLRAIF
jgi:hypothetical protein